MDVSRFVAELEARSISDESVAPIEGEAPPQQHHLGVIGLAPPVPAVEED